MGEVGANRAPHNIIAWRSRDGKRKACLTASGTALAPECLGGRWLGKGVLTSCWLPLPSAWSW